MRDKYQRRLSCTFLGQIEVFLFRAVEVEDNDGNLLWVDGQRLKKHYTGEVLKKSKESALIIFEENIFVKSSYIHKI